MERTLFKIKDIDGGDCELFERNFSLSSAHSNSLLTHSDFIGLPTEVNYQEIRLVLNCISYRHVDVCTIRSSYSSIHADIYLGRYEWIFRTKALSRWLWLKNTRSECLHDPDKLRTTSGAVCPLVFIRWLVGNVAYRDASPIFTNRCCTESTIAYLLRDVVAPSEPFAQPT